MPRMITDGQIAAIHAGKNACGMEETDYRQFLSSNFDGKNSSTKLTYAEASDCIKLLAKMSGKTIAVRPERRPNGIKRTTAEQYHKIKALQGLLDWNDARLDGFVQRQTSKLADVRNLMSWEAKKVIIGMQKIIAGKDKALYDFLNNIQPGDPETPAGRAIIKSIKMRLANGA